MSRWVLITGASQGIGYEFAKLFAENGYDVVLVARDRARLEQVAGEVRAQFGRKARVVAQDLGEAAAPQEIFDELQREQIFISILVNNAGFGFQGPFAELDLKGHRYLIQVNLNALMELTYLFLGPMLARREGKILNVASTAAFQPGPFMNLYYASKAFVHSFSCALSEELKKTGVTVTALCPGLTKSQFHTRANLKRPNHNLLMMDAEKVAKIGYRALMRDKPVVIAGWFNKVAVSIAKALPGTWTCKIIAAINKTSDKD